MEHDDKKLEQARARGHYSELARQAAGGDPIPVEQGALEASIAELDAWLAGECAEITASKFEAVTLALHELKRLRAVVAPQATVEPLTDEQIISRCKTAGMMWIGPTPADSEYIGPDEIFPSVSLEQMRALLVTQATCPECRGKGGFEESACGEGCCRAGVMCERCNGTGLATSKADTGDAGIPVSEIRNAARYEWLRNPLNNVALVLDKVTGAVPADGFGGGGYRTYEYRAGAELDAAIDAAMSATPSTIKAEPTEPPICGVMVGEDEMIGERCKDGGTCHHHCTKKCFRQAGCVPLSGSNLTDDWQKPTGEQS